MCNKEASSFKDLNSEIHSQCTLSHKIHSHTSRFKIQDSRTLFNHGKNSSGYILQTIAQTKLQIQKKIYIYMLHWKTCFP